LGGDNFSWHPRQNSTQSQAVDDVSLTSSLRDEPHQPPNICGGDADITRKIYSPTFSVLKIKLKNYLVALKLDLRE
jgi:hypothetical protein